VAVAKVATGAATERKRRIKTAMEAVVAATKSLPEVTQRKEARRALLTGPSLLDLPFSSNP
jgi:hypothetical protein